MASGHSFDEDEKNIFLTKMKKTFFPNTFCVGKYVLIGQKYGKIQYVGKIPGSNSVHFGIELEEAVGNDGKINNIRYFNCKENCGIFIPVENFVFNENCERFDLSSEAKVSDLFLSEKRFFQEDSNDHIVAPLDNIQPDSLSSSVQESTLNKLYIIFEEQDTDEPSILEETIEFHDDFDDDDELFESESFFSNCKAAKADQQLTEQAQLYIKEQENPVEDLRRNYSYDPNLGTSYELNKSPCNNLISGTGVVDLNVTVILSGKNELNEHAAVANTVDKNKSLNSDTCILQDLGEMDNSSDDSLGILPHLLNDESPWDSPIYDPSCVNLNATALLEKELNRCITVVNEDYKSKLPNPVTSVSSCSKSNKSPVSYIKNFPKYASTPKRDEYADVINEDQRFYDFGVSKASGVINKKGFELMLNEKNAKNLSPISANTSITNTNRMLNTTSNIFEDLETLPDEKNTYLNYSNEPTAIDTLNAVKLDKTQFIKNTGLEDSDFVADDFQSIKDITSQGLENFEAGSSTNTLNKTYTEDIWTNFETLTLKEPKNKTEMSFKSVERNTTARVNTTYEKIVVYPDELRYESGHEDLDDELVKDINETYYKVYYQTKLLGLDPKKSKNLPKLIRRRPKIAEPNKTEQLNITFEKSDKPEINFNSTQNLPQYTNKQTDNIKTSKQVDSKSKLKENSNLISLPVLLQNKIESKQLSLPKKTNEEKNFNHSTKSRVFSERKNETVILESFEKTTSDMYDVKENVISDISDKNKVLTEQKDINFSDNLLNTQPKTINKTLIIHSSDKSIFDEYTIEEQDCEECSLNKTVNLPLVTSDNEKDLLDESVIPLDEKSSFEIKNKFLGESGKRSSLEAPVTQTSVKKISIVSSERRYSSDVMKLKEKHPTKIPGELKLHKDVRSRIPASRINADPKAVKQRSLNKTWESKSSDASKRFLKETAIISEAQHQNKNKSESLSSKPLGAAHSACRMRTGIPVSNVGNRRQVTGKVSRRHVPKPEDPNAEKLKKTEKDKK